MSEPGKSPRRYSSAFKERIVLRPEAYRSMGTAGFNRKRGRKPGTTRARAPSDALARAQARIGELERVIGRQQADLHFFREALRLWDATSPNGGASPLVG
jgi:hypothetical protein